jgi:hypothetical protein
MAVVVIVKGLTFAHDVHVVDADVDERSVNEIVVVEAIIVDPAMHCTRIHGNQLQTRKCYVIIVVDGNAIRLLTKSSVHAAFTTCTDFIVDVA